MKNRNLTVVIFTQTLESGGAEKQAVLLSNILSDTFRVKLIVFYGDKTSQRITNLINNDVTLLLLRGNKVNKIISLYGILKKSNPYCLFNYLLLPNILGGLLSKFIAHSVSIGGIRSANLERKKIGFNRFAHNTLNKKTIFNNYSGYYWCTANGFKKDMAVVIPNAIDITHKKKIRNKSNVTKILSVGRFEEVKDYYTALKSIKELLNYTQDFIYIIVGWGSLEEKIREWIVELKIPNNNIEVIINPPQVENYYESSDIYLQTSLFEGLSNALLEAMSYCLPAIVTDVGDNSRLITDNETGFLVQIKYFSDIAEKLELLVNNRELREKMGNKGYDYIKQNFSEQKFKQRYTDLIKNLTNEE